MSSLDTARYMASSWMLILYAPGWSQFMNVGLIAIKDSMQRSDKASIVTLKTGEQVFKNGCHSSLRSSDATEYVPPKIWTEMEKRAFSCSSPFDWPVMKPLL